MGDGYDKLIHLLGLDSVRNDRILGVPELEFPPMETSGGGQPLRPSLCRLPDGRRQFVFQYTSVGNHWLGFIPCTPANLERLQSFVTAARPHLPATTPDKAPARRRNRLREFFRSPTSLESLESWPDPHPDVALRLDLLEQAPSEPRLQFRVQGPRGSLRVELPWTSTLADQLELFAKAGDRR